MPWRSNTSALGDDNFPAIAKHEEYRKLVRFLDYDIRTLDAATRWETNQASISSDYHKQPKTYILPRFTSLAGIRAFVPQPMYSHDNDQDEDVPPLEELGFAAQKILTQSSDVGGYEFGQLHFWELLEMAFSAGLAPQLKELVTFGLPENFTDSESAWLYERKDVTHLLTRHSPTLRSRQLEGMWFTCPGNSHDCTSETWIDTLKFMNENMNLESVNFHKFLASECKEAWEICEDFLSTGERETLKERVERFVVRKAPCPFSRLENTQLGKCLWEYKEDSSWEFDRHQVKRISES
ncbi:hypothetical protein B0J14DRAFT_565226 [Halenospora varia]|nr:hypothetical protein B0J14DRAFT_565226 [Halenospora varia]